ncbi:tRNA lysidine(34) synthetase TilS [Aeribacillus alveayuensis]|uniref:tRNA(Ile)-lysidine synthase n=1 Tax=Aeribacillus alveayuensis TaxID=279215 RepID=A0ABT9VR82_9BACI|nr:tRNA(Ile)-lysidine synthase [Bacillus alveayuensis]
MFEEVCKTIEEYELMDHNATVVVGVSGGPDSLALLHILHRLQSIYKLKIVAAHVDHMFRGEQSKEEMEFVLSFCRTLNIICEARQINVKAYAQKHRLNAQTAARECRYQFFQEMMEKYQAHFLALGHHGDDQIETILMRLVRGTVGKGLSGIPIKRSFAGGFIIRPLLWVTKTDIIQYCQEHKLNPRFDPSNEKDTYSRNRFRKYVLPFLKKENPKVHVHFQYFSELVAEDEQFLEELSIEKMNKVLERKTSSYVMMNLTEFKKLPSPLQRRVIHLILNYLFKGHRLTAVSSIHIEGIKKLIHQSHPSGMIDLPMGLKAIKSYETLNLTFEQHKPKPYRIQIEIPSVTNLPDGKKIICETFNGVPSYKSQDVFYLPQDQLVEPLIVRSRKAGDKIHVKGMNGTKKVKNIYIEKKIPIEKRDVWPIIEDGNGNILWIPLLKKSKYEVIDVTNQSYIVLQYKEQ